jgi:hypothetical protein
MANAARFRVDPRLASLLGEGYRSSEYAIKELVDNAWDADSTTVRITLPGALSGDPVVIEDDGTGMTEAEVRRDYLAIASSRRSRKGEFTAERRRPVKGRKGIGKFAGLMVADTMIVETRCRGTRTRLAIRKEDILAGEGAGAAASPYAPDLEAIDLPLEVAECPADEHGTTVTLIGLSQAFDPPTADRFKPILMLEYGRQEDFAIAVNGESIGVEDIPGTAFTHDEEIPDVGQVRLRFTVSDGKKALRQSGIALRATGKVIGKPTAFGLEHDEEIPPKLLKKVYGELEADGLANSATGDWGDVVETRAFAAVSGWASVHLKRALAEVFANEVQLARARLQQQVLRRLSQLPEHRRPFAEQRIERVLTSLYGEKEDRVATVVSVTLDAIEHDDYFVVVQAVDAASTKDVATFAAALGEFGLVDMAHMADQARRRLEFLERLDSLIGNPATREQEMHLALEHNLWVLGPQYAMLASNRTLGRMVEDLTSGKYKGERESERPDLLLLGSVTGRHLLVEFKRPGLSITREHEAQATTYRDELIAKLPSGIDVLLIGRQWARASDRTWVPDGLTVTSYSEVVAQARTELSWLLEQLTSEPVERERRVAPARALRDGRGVRS